MNDFANLLKQQKINYEKEGGYVERIAGDISSFRYPHLDSVSENFEYNPKKKTFFLTREIEETISKIATNEITFYELMNTEAKKLHLYDFFGYQATDEEKYNAYKSVVVDYQRNQNDGKWNLPFEIKEIELSKLRIRKDFEQLETFIENSKECTVYFCSFKDVKLMFQFGSTLKGTNIVFVDDSRANFCQELFHIIYHLEEGIPGVNNDNMNIEEVWGNVDALYVKQLMEGRLSRRIRKNQSPHDIKFLDYVFLRAYIGQAFLEEQEQPNFHSAYALIEPTMRLLVDSLEEPDRKAVNARLIDGICYDETEKIKHDFNKKYGKGAYESVFYDFNLFHRMETVKAICEKQKISYEHILEIMFDSQKMLPTVIDSAVVKMVWLNPEINQDKELIIDLIEGYSQEARKNKFTIVIDNWLEHVKVAFGMKKYETLKLLCRR